MTKVQYQREKDYLITMLIARQLVESGVITKEAYKKIDDLFIEKYNPILSVIFSELP